MKSANIVWYVATAEEPLTITELAEEMQTGRDALSSLVPLLHKEGLLERRKRKTESGRGPKPYEYWLAQRGSSDGAMQVKRERT